MVRLANQLLKSRLKCDSADFISLITSFTGFVPDFCLQVKVIWFFCWINSRLSAKDASLSFFWQGDLCSYMKFHCHFWYKGSWKPAKPIVVTKFPRSHVCLHSQSENRVYAVSCLVYIFKITMKWCCSLSLCYNNLRTKTDIGY